MAEIIGYKFLKQRIDFLEKIRHAEIIEVEPDREYQLLVRPRIFPQNKLFDYRVTIFGGVANIVDGDSRNVDNKVLRIIIQEMVGEYSFLLAESANGTPII